MRAFAIVIAAAALAAGCGPTRSVYNGGFGPGEGGTLRRASDLSPSEAGVTFKTDYAPPERNATYAGPTNRVRTEVPAAEEHTFLSIRSSSSMRDMRMASPTGGAAAASGVSSKVDSVPSQSVAGSAAPGSFGAGEQGASVGSSTAIRREGTSSAQRASEDSANLRQGDESAGMTTAAVPRNAQGIADSDAISQSAAAAQPLSDRTARGTAVYSASAAVRDAAAANAASSAGDTLVAKGQIESDSAESFAAAGQPLAEGTSEALKARSTAGGVAVRKAAVTSQGFTGSAAAQMLDGQDVVSGFGNAVLLIQNTQPSRLIIYRRFQAVVAREGSEALNTGAESNGLTTTRVPRDVLGLGDAAATSDAATANTGMDARTARTLARRSSFSGLTSSEWSSAPAGTVAVAPPDVFVLKEARLVDAYGIEKLRSAGIVRDLTSVSWLIGYRIHVLNTGQSPAKDVKVLDRLEAGSKLLVNSMSTTSQTASAKFIPQSGALEVSLPELESGGYFVVEFFVEPQAP